jgi:hypothetical protein
LTRRLNLKKGSAHAALISWWFGFIVGGQSLLEGTLVAAAFDDASLLPLTSVLTDGQQHLMHCTEVRLLLLLLLMLPFMLDLCAYRRELNMAQLEPPVHQLADAVSIL